MGWSATPPRDARQQVTLGRRGRAASDDRHSVSSPPLEQGQRRARIERWLGIGFVALDVAFVIVGQLTQGAARPPPAQRSQRNRCRPRLLLVIFVAIPLHLRPVRHRMLACWRGCGRLRRGLPWRRLRRGNGRLRRGTAPPATSTQERCNGNTTDEQTSDFQRHAFTFHAFNTRPCEAEISGLNALVTIS